MRYWTYIYSHSVQTNTLSTENDSICACICGCSYWENSCLIRHLVCMSHRLVISTCIQHAPTVDHPFETVPSNKSACLGQFAVFSCSSTVPNSRLFWFVNGAPVTALPEAYDALSSSVRDSSSDFRILALEENNNSMIVCAADTSNRISNFTKPVFLTGRYIHVIYLYSFGYYLITTDLYCD